MQCVILDILLGNCRHGENEGNGDYRSSLQLWGIFLLMLFRIPLDACQKDYLVMSTRFKKEFGLKIVRFADEYGLPEVRFPSFVREFGYEMTLAASDVVYSLMSLVEQPGKSLDDLWRNNFSIAFSAISDSSSFPLIKRGIDLAIKQHRILIHELNSVLNHRLLRYGPRFRYAVLRNGSDLAWFTSPQSLVKLAHFIVDAQKVYTILTEL